jgi:aldose 1-epimerase
MLRYAALAVIAALSLTSQQAFAYVARAPFGVLADGTKVEVVDLLNSRGVRARIISYGAALQTLIAPDTYGRRADVVLGYAKLDDYVANQQRLGAIVGRYAGRIANGQFVLDGKTYALTKNDGKNTLDGGAKGFDKVVWTIDKVDETSTESSVVMHYTAKDGEEGFPGALTVTVTYTLNENSELTIAYKATTDKPTVVNLTNHAYFNLTGEAYGVTALTERLTLSEDKFAALNADLLPTGDMVSVMGKSFDFRVEGTIADHLKDTTDPQMALLHGNIGHFFAIKGADGKKPQLAARLVEPSNGRVLEVLTTEPGVEFQTGYAFDGKSVGKSGTAYKAGAGVCFLAEHPADAPNQKKFPSTRLDPGKVYAQTTVYRFTSLPAPK